MCCRSSRLILGACLSSLLFLASGSNAEMGGGEGRPTAFVGQVDRAEGDCRISIDVDPISLLLTAVANKYRLVRVLIDCRGEASLALSPANDRLEMLVGDGDDGHAIAVLSLRQADAAVWDAFNTDMRRMLAYPPEVRAGEPVYVFAYFPIDRVEIAAERICVHHREPERDRTTQESQTAARN